MAVVSTVALPRGLWRDGICHRDADLEPVTGTVEAFLCDEGAALRPATRTTALLSLCMKRLGELSEVTSEDVKDLTVGDREALMIHLRRLTLGDAIECIVVCPASACQEKMELTITSDDVLARAPADGRASYEQTFDTSAGHVALSFRLPTGADLEAIAPAAVRNPEEAARELLLRCVDKVKGPGRKTVPAASVLPDLAPKIAAVMRELDSLAEITFQLTCPHCGHEFPLLFDVSDFFFRELQARHHGIFEEVHLLAYHYHWNEKDILEMTSRRRQRYLGLLADQLSREVRQ